MNVSVVFTGFLLAFVPAVLKLPRFSQITGVKIATSTLALFLVYGMSTIVGGVLRGQAKSLGYFVDISTVLGAILFILGPLTGFMDGSTWFNVSVGSLLLISLPSTAAVWYTRDSAY